MVPSFSWNHERDDAIRAELIRMRAISGSDMVLVLFTNVLEKSSDLHGTADPDLVFDIFGEDLPLRLEGVMSRKLDFLPWLGARLRGQTRR
jgi:manganese-dependent inorganic pyrophosphatase